MITKPTLLPMGHSKLGVSTMAACTKIVPSLVKILYVLEVIGAITEALSFHLE